jgi:DNA-binding NarL/FixJ family response regulator
MEKPITKILVLEDARWPHNEIELMINKHMDNVELLHAYNRVEAEILYHQHPDLDMIIGDLDINHEKGKVPLQRKIGLDFLEDVRAGNRVIHLIAYTIYNDSATLIRLNKINATLVRKYSFGAPSLLLITVILKLLNCKTKMS